MLGELYSIHAAGLTPDMDLVRERLLDRPDLFEAAEKRRFVGQHMQDAEDHLTRILGWFAKQKTRAEDKALTERLRNDVLEPEQAAELLRQLQRKVPTA